MPEKSSNIQLSSTQESNYIFNIDQESDWWPSLIWKYCILEEKEYANLLNAMIETPEEWKKCVAEYKIEGKKDLREIILNKTEEWAKHIQIILEDPVQIKLLDLYLKNLVLLKHKRVTDIGTRAKTKQRINSITSGMGDDALSTLESYKYALEHLANIRQLADQTKSQSAITYYEIRKQEESIQIALLLGAIMLFRNARSSEDVQQLQKYFENRVIRLIEHKLLSITDIHEIAKMHEKISSYKQLINAIEINFE
jgi:hypothetical protein